MDKYAIFLDIDGTLSTGGKVPEENSRMIREAQKQGHYVFINTGRSFAYVPEHVKACADFDGFVCGLGADVRIHGEQVLSKTFSTELAMKLSELFLPMPEHVALFEGEDHIYFTKTWYDVPFGIQISSPEDFKTKYPEAKISKFTCEPVEKELLAPVLNELMLYDQGSYFEMAQKGCTKATAMQFAAEFLNIPHERCVAIGDSVNDEDMLKAAGIAVVMENGDAAMKKLATFLTASAEDAGVAKAIEKLIF